MEISFQTESLGFHLMFPEPCISIRPFVFQLYADYPPLLSDVMPSALAHAILSAPQEPSSQFL